MKYDLVIAGGGTAGCACAYTAGKLGMSVLLIEKNSFLGGTMTSSLVTPAMSTSRHNINTSFYKILMAELFKLGGEVTYPDNNIGWFNPELMKIVLDNLMDEAGVDVLFNTQISEIKKIEDTWSININESIDSIYTDNIISKNKILLEYIESTYLVDATGDAKIFQKLNCEFLENENKFQPINLRFIMSGIDVCRFADWVTDIDKDRSVSSSYIVDGEIHMTTAYTWDTGRKWALKPIFDEGLANGDITEADSNYFQVFSIPGMPSSLAFNCPRMITNEEVNPNNPYDTTKVLKQGRASILRLSKFMKKRFLGFEESYISSIANTLGIRVSNRIRGKYIYTLNDLVTNKKFDNPCLVSNYPIDIHSSTKDGSKLQRSKGEYSLPIESLISNDYENLFAIGRCISAEFEAQAALRIIPSCFSMGEGLAKYLAY